jgi:hypothetical protein
VPHLWLGDGAALYDHLGRGFALIDTGQEPADVAAIAQAFAALGAPFEPVWAGPAARSVLDRRFVLVRPDLHVVWRGEVLPEQPSTLAALTCGWLTAAASAAA